MDNIIIFEETVLEDNLSNKSQLELYYDNLKKDKKFNPISVDAFYEMEQFEDSIKFIKSEIPTIIINNILDYITIKADKIPEQITNSPFTKSQPISQKEKVIMFKAPKNLICQVGNSRIQISKNSMLRVIGLKLNKTIDICDTLQILNFLTDAPDIDLFQSGSFSLINFVNNQYFKFYISIDNTDQFITLDLANQNITQQLFQIQNKILKAREYYDTSLINMSMRIYDETSKWCTIQTKQQSTKQKPTIQILNITASQQQILKKISKIINAELNYAFIQQIQYYLSQLNVFDIYNKLVINDLIKDDSDELYNIIQQQINKEEMVRQQKTYIVERQLEIYTKNRLAFTKFKILNYLDLGVDQKKIVDKEFQKELDRIRIEKENPEESQLVNALQHSIDTQQAEQIESALKNLEKIVKLPKNILKVNDFIQNKKKQNIICPHVIYKAQLSIEKYKDEITKINDIRNNLIQGFATEPISQEIDNNFGYFCRICGEQLATLNQIVISKAEQTAYSYNSENTFSNIYNAIYRELYYIINNFIEFNIEQMPNLQSIVRNITELLKNEIYLIESNIIKIKTISKQDTAALLNIYIYIYAFAFFTQLIYTNEFINFKNYTGGKDASQITQNRFSLKGKTKNIKDLQNIINNALNLIKKIKYYEIQKLSNFSMESVKPLFLKAYKYVIGIQYTTLGFSTETYFIQNNIINYFIYAYNKTASNQIETIQNYDLNKLLYKQNNTIFKNIKNILGRSYQNIVNDIPKNISTFATLVKPKQWTQDKYIYGSILFLYEYIIQSLYLSSPLNKREQVLVDNFKYIYDIEKTKRLEFKKKQLKPFIAITQIPFSCNKPSIYYCKSLKEQEKFVYNHNGKKVELTKDEINDMLAAGKHIKDYELMSIICKNSKSPKEQELILFYNYYNNNCPIGGLHDFKNQVCKKCKLTSSDLQNYNKDYYKKYKSNFQSDKKKQVQLMNKQIQYLKVKQKVEKIEEFPKWDYERNIGLISQAAKLLQVSENKIINMGLTNKQEKSQIYKSRIDTSKLPRERIVVRNNTIVDYYLFVVRNYYCLRGSEFTIQHPHVVRQILDKYSNKNIIQKLPTIQKDFLKQYQYYQRTMEPKNLTNFLLVQLSNIFLQINNVFQKQNMQKMGKDFITLLFNQIIAFEEKLTNFIVMRIGDVSTITEQVDVDEVRFEIEQDQGDADYIQPIYDEPVEIEDGEQEEEDLFGLEDVDLEEIEENDDNFYGDIQEDIQL